MDRSIIVSGNNSRGNSFTHSGAIHGILYVRYKLYELETLESIVASILFVIYDSKSTAIECNLIADLSLVSW